MQYNTYCSHPFFSRFFLSVSELELFLMKNYYKIVNNLKTNNFGNVFF